VTFILRIISNTHTLGKLQIFLILKPVVHIVITAIRVKILLYKQNYALINERFHEFAYRFFAVF
jgi:hypothetical protein